MNAVSVKTGPYMDLQRAHVPRFLAAAKPELLSWKTATRQLPVKSKIAVRRTVGELAFELLRTEGGESVEDRDAGKAEDPSE